MYASVQLETSSPVISIEARGTRRQPNLHGRPRFRLETAIDTSIPRVLIDEIVVSEGDYLDIGEPVDAGGSVPVVIKSLVFGQLS